MREGIAGAMVVFGVLGAAVGGIAAGLNLMAGSRSDSSSGSDDAILDAKMYATISLICAGVALGGYFLGRN